MPSDPTPLALSAADVGALLSVSARQIWSMHAAGTLGPAPTALGPRLARWDRAEIEAWWHACRAAGRRIGRREWAAMREGGGDAMSDTYVKMFPTMFSGSMYGAGLHVFATWAWVLTHKDENGLVEVNPKLVAAELGAEVEQIERAMEYLTAPDPDSRSPEEDGRRMVRVSQFGYRVVNHAKYANRGRDRTEYWREYKRRQRARKCGVDTVDTVDSPPKSTHVDVDVDVDVNAKREEKRTATLRAPSSDSRKRFKPPTAEEATEYARSIGYALDGQSFVDYYQSKGWLVGRAPMKCWRSSVRTWKSRDSKPSEPVPETAEQTLARLKSKGLM